MGDVLTKAPVPILLFAVGEIITDKSLFATRIVNSVASILSVVPLFFLIQVLMDRRAARIGAILWLLGSGSIIFHTVGHTQAIASFFAVTCLWFFVAGTVSFRAPTRNPLRFPIRSGMTAFFLAGFCFVLAYASRKTALALVIPLALSWVVLRDVRGGIVRACTIFLLGALVVVIPWFAWMYALYGFSGVWHAVGAGYGDILVHSQSITPWAGSADRMFAESARIGLMYGALLLLICIAVLRNHKVLIGASWIATLTILYFLWPTHLVEYLADFIPAIVVAGAVAIGSLNLSKVHASILTLLLLGLSLSSLRSVYIHPWTGMFTRDAVVQSAAWILKSIPMDQQIFTAAVIIPYLSGHHVPFNLSHPQWYGYAFISQNDKSIFLPSYGELEKVVQQEVSWVLRDQLTDYVYPGITFSAFQESIRFPNNTGYRQNPLRVYLKHEN